LTVITHSRRKSNLAKMIDAAGGVSVGAALVQARANLESLRGQALTVVDAQIGALEALMPPVGADDTPARLEAAYRVCTTLIDAAGPFAMTDLCRAAAGLCDLIGAIPPDRPFDWRIVTVHARSMRLLQALPANAVEERGRILDSLAEVIERKLNQTG
jgi:hypothetical protein